jgi:hypothetical protein
LRHPIEAAHLERVGLQKGLKRVATLELSDRAVAALMCFALVETALIPVTSI